MSETQHVTDPTQVRAEPIYTLETGETYIGYSHTPEGILNHAKTWIEEGGDAGEILIFRAGEYDPALTAAAQQGLI